MPCTIKVNLRGLCSSKYQLGNKLLATDRQQWLVLFGKRGLWEWLV